jgi:hypothetical protein
VEIRREVSDAFAAAVADLPANEPRISRAGDGPMPRPGFRKVFQSKSGGGKSGGSKSGGGKPAYRKPGAPRRFAGQRHG